MRFTLRSIALSLAAITTTAMLPGAAHAASGVVVGGPTPATASSIFINGSEVQLGRATRAVVQKAEKRRPDGIFTLSARFGAGTVLVYAGAAGCWRQYTIPDGSSRVADFETTCPYAHTYNGVHPAMRAEAAATTSRSEWTPAQYGSHVCPLGGSVLSLSTTAPFLAAMSDASSARVESIGLFSSDPLLAQVARCGASPF